MIKLSFCLRRLPHLSREEFQRYWRHTHPAVLPAETIPTLGIKRYVQVHTLDTEALERAVGPRTDIEEQFDGIAELWVEDVEALDRNWSTDEARRLIEAFIADEANFVDWSRSTIHVSEEHVLYEEQPDRS